MNVTYNNILHATLGQFRTLDGADYIGPYYINRQGMPKTGHPQSMDSQPLITYTEGILDQSNPLTTQTVNTALNENETVYDLMPVIINRPPVVIRTIREASLPPIRPYAVADATPGYMHEFPDGTIKVQKGTSIQLRVEAQQPDILNVENGQLVIKPSDFELTYNWTTPTNITGDQQGDELTALGIIVDPNALEPLVIPANPEQATVKLENNTLTITNIQPEFAGTYTCTVSNDIGSTDAGSITIEVFNSERDSLLYSNLVLNPNADDGLENWNVVDDTLQRSSFKDPLNTQLKEIITDPFDTSLFGWTTEMLHPRPFQIDMGVIRSQIPPSPQNVDSNYFTRVPYTYVVNNGKAVAQAYQDIDLTPLESHIKGAVHGVDGLRAIFCAYIGNGIFNYEPNEEFSLPSQRAQSGSYYPGAARLSIQNFSKAGPGFVKEKVTVTLEEYANNQSIASRILNVNSVGSQSIEIGTPTLQDPWTSLLPKYENRVYYLGDEGYTTPDEPSLGDRRDAHLFVADELMPKQEDRYSYGQYGKLQKVIIDRLDPRTTKVRITINIEATDLALVMRERGSSELPTNLGKLWEVLPWTTSWPSRSLGPRKNDRWPASSNVFGKIVYSDYLPNTPLRQKLPTIGESRALVTGLTFAITPIHTNDKNLSDAQALLSITENPLGEPFEIPSAVDLAAPAYDSVGETNAILSVATPTNIEFFTALFLNKYQTGELRDVIEEDENLRGVFNTLWVVANEPDKAAGRIELLFDNEYLMLIAQQRGDGSDASTAAVMQELNSQLFYVFEKQNYGLYLTRVFDFLGINTTAFNKLQLVDTTLQALKRVPRDSKGTIYSLLGGGDVVTDGSDAPTN